jgi:hypothetical protein
MKDFPWGGYNLTVNENDPNEELDLSPVTPVRPLNLRVATFPYPHLRDDEGTVLARDFMDLGKLAFILDALDKA